jgi:hypothetical protein
VSLRRRAADRLHRAGIPLGNIAHMMEWMAASLSDLSSARPARRVDAGDARSPQETAGFRRARVLPA